MKLERKRVLVTGGSSGIGFAIASALLAKGAKVAVTGRRAAVVASAVDDLREIGGSATGIAADVGTDEGRQRKSPVRSIATSTRRTGSTGSCIAERPFLAGDTYTIADMATYPRIVPWKQQQQNLDDFVNLRRWFDSIAARPGTRRAYAKGEPFSAQPAVTEEGKKLLFGQTAASVTKS
jgi:hypothetical protein